MARFKTLFTTAIISSAGIIVGCASTDQVASDIEDAQVAQQLAGEPTARATVGEPAVDEEKIVENAEEEELDEHVTEIKNKNKVVCRREKLTGTRFPRRICMTVAQREEMARESQKWLSSGGFSGDVQSVADGLVDPKAKR